MVSRNNFNKILNEWVRWAYLGWFDVLSRYRRTVLGPLWIVLMSSLTIVTIGFVYGSLFKLPAQEFIPYLTIGMVTWTWMSTSLIESCSAFHAYKFIMINHLVQPISIVFRVISRNFIILIHNCLVILFVLIFYEVPISRSLFLLFLSFPLISAVILAIGVVLAYSCSRFHDLTQLTTSLMGSMFMVTPVAWMPKILGERMYIAFMNPFTHLLDLIRLPLLGQVPEMMSWIITISILITFGFMAYFMSSIFQRRVLFWL